MVFFDIMKHVKIGACSVTKKAYPSRCLAASKKSVHLLFLPPFSHSSLFPECALHVANVQY